MIGPSAFCSNIQTFPANEVAVPFSPPAPVHPVSEKRSSKTHGLIG